MVEGDPTRRPRRAPPGGSSAGRVIPRATPAPGPPPRPGAAPTQAVLGRVAADLSGELDLGALLELVVDRAERIFAADRVAVWLLEPGGRAIVLGRPAAERRLRPALAEAAVTATGAARGAVREAIRRRQLRVVRAGGTGPALGRTLRQEGLVRACFAPILLRDETLGLLGLYHATDRAWTGAEREQVRAFADQVAAAVQNARLYASVRDLAARLEAVGDLAARLNRIQDVERIGEAIVAEAGSLIDADTIRVYRVDETTGWCEPIAYVGTFLGVDRPTPEMLRLRVGEGLTGWVAEHARPLLTGDAGADPRTIVIGEDSEPESMLIVPMRFEDRVRGLVAVSKVGRDRFTSDDEATLSIFAAYAAQALVNAEHAEQVRQQQAELSQQLAGQRRLLDITERLVAARDPGEVLELVADALKRLIAYDTLTIYAVDRARGTRRAVVARDRFAEVILEYEAPLGTGLTGWAIEHAEAVRANEAHLDPRTQQIPGTPFEPESMIVVPLLGNGVVVGTLNVGRIGGPQAFFSDHEFELTKLFAGQASLALQNAEAHREATARARLDALTGLLNHGAFQQELGDRLAASPGEPMALLMLDLDGFKAFNDTHGHPAGDRLLRDVAGALQRSVREDDRVYRYGGDEFAVVLPGADRFAALEVADRIRRAIAVLELPADGPRLGVSVGLACHPDDGRTKDDLVSGADRALYLAKPVRVGEGHDGDPRDAYLAALNETALALMDRLEPRDLLEAILARATAILGMSNGYIYLLEPAGDAFVVRVGTGVFGGLLGFRMPADQGLAGLVRRTGRPQVIADYDAWPDRSPAIPTGLMGSVAAVPLTSGPAVVGVLGLASGATVRSFGERELAVLSRLAQLASIALDNARLLDAAQRELAERTRAEAALRASEERFHRLSDAAAEALAIHRDGRILEVNQSFRELFRCTDEEAIGHTIGEFVAPGSRRTLTAHWRHHPDEPVEVVARDRGGEVFPVVVLGRQIPYPDGPARVASIRDLRERRSLEERLARQARTDRVTGLPNRDELTERLAATLAGPLADGRSFALLLLDVDRFKVINERLGHSAGDDLLAEAGRRLVDAVRPGDVVARFGGDEFALLLAAPTGPAEARTVAERLEVELRRPFWLHGREGYVTARIGIVVTRPGAGTPWEAFRDAEIALQRAKSDPVTTIALFEPSMSAETLERLDLEADLRRAVDREELRLVYQPIVDLRTERIVGVEALVRWLHPTRGLIQPGDFIPLAEETGLILPIGRWVLGEACRQARAWRQADPGVAALTISVNLSARQFGAADLVELVEGMLTANGLSAADLELEITESVLMDRSEPAIAALRSLRSVGVRLALDDFGTGYSSLAYLRELPLDAIKVDRTFVGELASDPAARSIVQAVVSLAHGLGIEVVAEGIETREQLRLARSLGCDRGQGFLYARPRPAESLAELLMLGSTRPSAGVGTAAPGDGVGRDGGAARGAERPRSGGSGRGRSVGSMPSPPAARSGRRGR